MTAFFLKLFRWKLTIEHQILKDSYRKVPWCELCVVMSMPRIRSKFCDIFHLQWQFQGKTHRISSALSLHWSSVLLETGLHDFIYLFLKSGMLYAIWQCTILNYLKYFGSELTCLRCSASYWSPGRAGLGYLVSPLSYLITTPGILFLSLLNLSNCLRHEADS